MHLNQELAISQQQPDPPPDLTSEDSLEGTASSENLILLESSHQQPLNFTGGQIEANPAGIEGCENTHFVVNSSNEAPSGGAANTVVVEPSTTANQNTTLSTISSCHEGPFSEELIQYDTRL